METIIEKKEYMCKFCNKKFPSGKSLGGHIRIHTNEYSLHSTSYNAKNPNKKKKNNKRLVDQREITALKHQQQLCCSKCGKGFDSLKDLWSHMDCCHCEGEKLVMDTGTPSSGGSSRKRSKKQSSSESFSNGSSSSSEIDQEDNNTALSLMMMSMDYRGITFVVNSLVAESLENNSQILVTKLSSEEQLKMIFNVADHDDDDSGAILSDSCSSDSDYFMNGPKKSDSDISVDGCLSNTGFNRNGDSCAVDTNIMIHRSSDGKSPMVKKEVSANKKSKVHECPVCFRVFKSGQALGGHKRSHSIENQEHRIKHKAADMRIDLNLPAHDIEK